MLTNILTGKTSDTFTAEALVVCLIAALVLGVLIAFVHSYKNSRRTNFTLALVILPAIVASVIMLVNGNIGTGVAVMGAFSLIRFRSAPGNSREIASIFLAMAAGLAVGTGYIWIGVVITLVIGMAIIIVLAVSKGADGDPARTLKVTIPETLDYEGVFDDIFAKYAQSATLMKVRTVNMGSLYELCYDLTMKGGGAEKKMIDEIRARNGNLPVVCGRVPEDDTAL